MNDGPPDYYKTIEDWLKAVTPLDIRGDRDYKVWVQVGLNPRLPPDPVCHFGPEAFAAAGGWEMVPSVRQFRREQEALKNPPPSPKPQERKVRTYPKPKPKPAPPSPPLTTTAIAPLPEPERPEPPPPPAKKPLPRDDTPQRTGPSPAPKEKRGNSATINQWTYDWNDDD